MLNEDQIIEAFDRVGTKAYSSLTEGEFQPFLPSAEIQQAFEEKGRKRKNGLVPFRRNREGYGRN